MPSDEQKALAVVGAMLMGWETIPGLYSVAYRFDSIATGRSYRIWAMLHNPAHWTMTVRHGNNVLDFMDFYESLGEAQQAALRRELNLRGANDEDM